MISALWLSVALQAQGDLRIQRLVQALPVEAANFARHSGRLLSEETLRHRAYESPKKWTQHEVVSTYSFAALNEKSQAIREIRQVTMVDGKPVKRDRGLESVATAVAAGGSDKEKRKLFEQLEKYGVKSFATDIGQLLLLFSQSSILNYEFTYQGKKNIGAQPVLMFAYRQTDGPASMTVFKDRDVKRPKLAGEVWVLEKDYRLIRVALHTLVPVSDTVMSRQEMTVDYAWWPAAGCVMPAAALHREYSNSFPVAENIYRYAPFQTFAAAAARRKQP